MMIRTSSFGEVEIPEEQVLTFEQGIPAFEELRRFVMLDAGEDSAFSYLQSMEDEHICFVVTSPFLFHANYDFQLPEGAQEELQLADEKQIGIYCIVTVPKRIQDATINLLAPIVVNLSNRTGRQIILHETTYKPKQLLFSSETVAGRESTGGEPTC